MKLRIKQLLIAIGALLLGTNAFAHDFEVDGIFYNILSSNTVKVTFEGSTYKASSDEYTGTVTIPSTVTSSETTYSVTEIDTSAFRNCSKLTSVTIPNSVTKIGDYAFNGCSGLTSITIPNSVTEIGNSALIGCTGLTSINVESGNSNYDSRDNCNALIETGTNSLIVGCQNTVIPASVTSIGDYAFYNCSGLTSIEIPNSVTEIGTYAFSSCTGLTSVSIGNSVSSIGSYAFYNCSGLTSIEIPNSVTEIGNNAFDCCTGLTSVTIPDSVTEIGDSAFEGCSGLTSVTIPNSVTKIGDYAFYGCDNLVSVTIPGSVTAIGPYAFAYCYELASITSLIPADNLFAIESSVFNGVDKSDCTLYVPAGAKDTYATTDGWNEFANIVDSDEQEGQDEQNKCGNNAYWSFNEETGVLTISGTGAMYDFEYDSAPWYNILGIKSVEIESGITTIGDYAFYYCSEMTSVTIPSSVTAIGECAFSDCRSLTSLEIPYSVTEIEYGAFFHCYSLTSINVESGNSKFDSRDNCNAIIETETNTLIIGCQNSGIPNSVTAIGSYAFYDCTEMTSITIPNSVTAIGNSAFDSCYGLTEVTIPKSVTKIGDGVFNECYALTSLNVESGNSTYDSRDNCNAIIETETNTLIVGCQNSVIPNSVTAIGNYAFHGCRGLTEVSIPNSVTKIGNWAFYGCYGLTSVTIPDSVTEIGDGAFYDCAEMTSITIPNSVTEIGDYAFALCSVLTKVTIPDSVTAIGPYAFAYCYELASITSLIPADKLFAIESSVFYYVDNSACTLYVPAGAKDTYATTEGWNAFLNIEELPEDYTSVSTIELGNNDVDAIYYDLYGRRVTNPSNGIYIVNGKKVYIK